MYKLLVLDMDGTLLNEQCEISKDNIEAIKKGQTKWCSCCNCNRKNKNGHRPILGPTGYKCAW